MHVFVLAASLMSQDNGLTASVQEEQFRAPAPRPVEVRWFDGEITALDAVSFTVRDNKQSLIRFGLTPQLAAGGVADKLLVFAHHRFSDLKVGDRVTLEYRDAGGPKVCFHVQIRKRPGGLIPPAQDQNRKHARYHDVMNAHWDTVDRAIPTPEHLKPNFPTPVLPSPATAPPPREKK
jgi:hypothetical protein